MNRTQKLLEVARWVYPALDWKVTSDGELFAPEPEKYFNLSDRKTRQDTIMKLREHGWKIEQRKNYWLGVKVDSTGKTEIKKATFEELVWDLVGRVQQ